MEVDEEKAAFNARAEASMLLFLKSKSWPEKIRSRKAAPRPSLELAKLPSFRIC